MDHTNTTRHAVYEWLIKNALSPREGFLMKQILVDMKGTSSGAISGCLHNLEKRGAITSKRPEKGKGRLYRVKNSKTIRKLFKFGPKGDKLKTHLAYRRTLPSSIEGAHSPGRPLSDRVKYLEAQFQSMKRTVERLQRELGV